MNGDSEWYGEPHILIVTDVTPPDGPFDDGELDYDLQHPSTCKEEESFGGRVKDYACDVAHIESEAGLASALRYSGTPVTEPGTYRIQGWGRKTWYPYYGAYEYDNGVGVMQPEEAAS